MIGLKLSEKGVSLGKSDCSRKKMAIIGIAASPFSEVDLTFCTETHRRLWASFRDERI
jgi:hypothetical protein